ncbi:MAG: hypothetical protein K2X81_17845 [Candidatus Obscuribacterales bacterium]|nr:hypothetical protein [Candidatus Obscuribacterales bacterium]
MRRYQQGGTRNNGLGHMSFDWIKDQTNKVIKAVGDEGSALYKEAQHLVESAEHKLSGSDAKSTESKSSDAKSTDAKLSENKTLEITPIKQGADLKASKTEAQLLNTKTEATKHESSVLGTVSDYVSKAAVGATAAISSALGSLGVPLGAGIIAGIKAGTALVQVAENLYQSADKKVTVTEVKGAESTQIKEGFAKLFDESNAKASDKKTEKPTTEAAVPKAEQAKTIEFNNIFDAIKHVEKAKTSDSKEGASRVSNQESSIPDDVKRWLFNDPTERCAGQAKLDSHNLFSYPLADGGKTEINNQPGHVHLEQRDENGNVRTIVDKTKDRLVVLKDKESVIKEGDKTVVKGPDYTVSWDDQGNRHIEWGNQEIIRNKIDNTIQVIDKNAGPKIASHDGQVTVGDNVAFVSNTIKDLNALTADALKTLQKGEDGQVYMIAIPGGGTRTIAKDGTTLDVLENKARLTTPDQKVIQLETKDDKLFIRQGDKLVPLDKEHFEEAGGKKIGTFELDPATLRLRTQNYFLDILKNHQQLIDRQGQTIDAFLRPDNCATVKIGNTTVENAPDSNKVVISKAPDLKPGDSTNDKSVQPVKIVIDQDTNKVEIKDNKTDKLLLTDTPKNTTIADTNTVIDADRTVHIGNTVVRPDGAVQVDKHTFIDKDMHISSTAADISTSHAPNTATQASAQSVAANISGKAMSISGMAKAGVVKWTEVAALNTALGDVLGLMGSMPVGSQAYAMLQESYNLLVNAINVATPKALATEDANSRGITAPSAVKAMEEGVSEAELKARKQAA